MWGKLKNKDALYIDKMGYYLQGYTVVCEKILKSWNYAVLSAQCGNIN